MPSHQGRAAIHRPECSLRSVECVLMHNITIFPFLHLCIDLFIQVAQRFLCAGNFVPLSYRKNEVDAIFQNKKKTKTTINTPNDRLCIPDVLFTSLEKYLTCYTKKS